MTSTAICKRCMELWERLQSATMRWARAKELFARGQLRSGTAVDRGTDLAGAELERAAARQAYREHKRTVHGEDLVVLRGVVAASFKAGGQ
jgi:hypothetical protein